MTLGDDLVGSMPESPIAKAAFRTGARLLSSVWGGASAASSSGSIGGGHGEDPTTPTPSARYTRTPPGSTVRAKGASRSRNEDVGGLEDIVDLTEPQTPTPASRTHAKFAHPPVPLSHETGTDIPRSSADDLAQEEVFPSTGASQGAAQPSTPSTTASASAPKGKEKATDPINAPAGPAPLASRTGPSPSNDAGPSGNHSKPSASRSKPERETGEKSDDASRAGPSRRRRSPPVADGDDADVEDEGERPARGNPADLPRFDDSQPITGAMLQQFAVKLATHVAKEVLREAGLPNRTTPAAATQTASSASTKRSAPDDHDDSGKYFAAKPPRPLKRRAGTKVTLEKVVRKRLEEIFSGTDKVFGPDIQPTQKSEILNLYATDTQGNPDIQRDYVFPLRRLSFGFTANDVAFDWGDAPHCVWNRFAAQVFIDDFCHTHTTYTREEITKQVWSRVKVLHQDWIDVEDDKRTAIARNVPAGVVRAERLTRKRRNGRPKSLWDRRHDAAVSVSEDDDPNRILLQLVEGLTFKGMSGDESERETPNGEKRRMVKRPIWRARWVRRFLVLLDTIYERLQKDKKALALDQRGRSCDPRIMREDNVDATSRPVPGLPQNLYEADWLAHQDEEWVERKLQPGQLLFPETLPLSLMDLLLAHAA